MSRRNFYGRSKFPTPDGFKERLNEAFKDMRKAGLLARQNYLCCGSCAGYGIAGIFQERVDKDEKMLEKIKGSVFYHHQDTENLNNPNTESFYLRYGKISTSKNNETALSTEEVGKIITEILTKHGIVCSWNGDADTCIEVFKKYVEVAPVEVEEPMLVGLA